MVSTINLIKPGPIGYHLSHYQSLLMWVKP
jgi:hypothetical protein